MKNIIIIISLIVVLGAGAYLLIGKSSDSDTVNLSSENATTSAQQTNNIEQNIPPIDKTKTVLGQSVGKKDITAYHYGEGDSEVLFVGGIHGGYEWNTVLLARQLMDYLKTNPNSIPKNLKVTVIPVLNPDGLYKVVGTTDVFSKTDVSSSESVVTSGRFNGNNVDLSRNFDCDWKAEAKWQEKTISGGNSVFSEPESKAMKKYVETNKPSAVIVWYSAAGGVFASSCHNGVSKETDTLTKTFATASGYKAYNSFDFYAITGDMVNWLAKNNIPAISVLLTNHTETEWTKNKKGIDAVLKYYAK